MTNETKKGIMKIKQADGTFIELLPQTKSDSVFHGNLTVKNVLDENVDSIILSHVESTLKNSAYKINKYTKIYEMDIDKNPENIVYEYYEPGYTEGKTIHHMYLSLDGIQSEFKKFSESDPYIYVIVIDNSYAIIGAYDNTDYDGPSSFYYKDYFRINTRFSYPSVRYPFSPLIIENDYTGYQNFYNNTYNPDEGLMEIYADGKTYGDRVISNVKIYECQCDKIYPTHKSCVEDTIDFIRNTYGYDYTLRLSYDITFDVEGHEQYVNDRIMKFSKATNCIVDWGDGTVEKFSGVTYIDHDYPNAGKYRLNVYSDDYLYFTRGTPYDGIVQIHTIDFSKHTSMYEILPTRDYVTLDPGVTFDLTNVKDIRKYAFANITNLDVSIFEKCTGIISLRDTFCGCSWLTEIPMTLDTSKVTDWRCAFQAMQGITHIPALNTTAGVDCSHIFMDSCRIRTMEELDFCNATTLLGCFAANHSLEEIKIKNTGKVTNFASLCYDCVSLESLTELDISAIDMTAATNEDGSATVKGLLEIFRNCWKLRYVKVVGDATADKIDELIKALPTFILEGVEKQIDISACTNKNSITATKEGWTIIK